MEKHLRINLELSKEELVLIQMLTAYLCFSTGVEVEKVSDDEFKIQPSLEFIKEQLERIDKSSVRLKFPKEFFRTIKEIFGVEIKGLVISSEELTVIDDLNCLLSVSISKEEVITDFYYDPITDESLERCLSIDLGIKNPVTVFDSKTGNCMILGRDYMSRSYYFDSKVQELKNNYIIHGLDNFDTKRMKQLLSKKENTLTDILHKITRYLADYCVEKKITKVVVGDIKEKPRSLFPYNRFFKLLKRKLSKLGIETVKQSELFTSQCPPDSPEVSREFASKGKRLMRGLFKDGKHKFNADGLAAFNILKSYLSDFGRKLEVPLEGIKSPTVVIVSD